MRWVHVQGERDRDRQTLASRCMRLEPTPAEAKVNRKHGLRPAQHHLAASDRVVRSPTRRSMFQSNQSHPCSYHCSWYWFVWFGFHRLPAQELDVQHTQHNHSARSAPFGTTDNADAPTTSWLHGASRKKGGGTPHGDCGRGVCFSQERSKDGQTDGNLLDSDRDQQKEAVR
jgi:hypothetical protein